MWLTGKQLTLNLCADGSQVFEEPGRTPLPLHLLLLLDHVKVVVAVADMLKSVVCQRALLILQRYAKKHNPRTDKQGST